MLKGSLTLNDQQKDILKEIANICAGNAATSLSQLINRRIEMNVPDVHFIRVENVPECVGGAETLVVGVVCQVYGDAPGVILLIFPQKDARILAQILTNKKTEDGIFTEMDQSSVKEAGSILAAAYLNTLSKFTDLSLIPSTPTILIDMVGALIDYILIELAEVSEYALLIDSYFIDAERRVKGHFFLLPNLGSLEAILKTIGD